MKLPANYFSYSLKVTRISFAVLGIFICEGRQATSKIKSFLGNSLFLVCYILFCMSLTGEFTLFIKFLNINFLAVTNVVPCICYSFMEIVKLGSIVYNIDKSKKLINDFEDLWPTEDLDENQVEMVVKCIGKGTKANTIFAIVNVLFAWTFSLSSIIILVIQYINTGVIVKTLPYLIYLPFDTTGTVGYPLAYLFHMAAGHIGSTGLTASDSFFVSAICHICTQFKLLQYRIEKNVQDMTPEDIHTGDDIDHNYHGKMYQALIECVRRHADLITLTDTIEEIFSLSILINFMGSSAMICCVGFQTTAVSGLEMVIFLLFLTVCLLQIFVLSWAGNLLIETSSQIADAAYNSLWYLTDKKYRQLIHIIISRAQRPQKVTGLKFSVVSLKSFASIMSTSWSYFTLIQTAYKNE